MNTNTGQNWQAVFLLVVSGLDQMPDGYLKHSLLGIAMICMALIAFWTKGSGLSEADAQKIIDAVKGDNQ